MAVLNNDRLWLRFILHAVAVCGIILLVMAVCFSLSHSNCFNLSHSNYKNHHGAIVPSIVASKAMELYDTDRDGKISGKELDKVPGLKAALKLLKTDATQGVTEAQISDRVNKWIESKIGRQTVMCKVTHNGLPVVGATVKFVPELFLADYLIITPQGKTNTAGMAMISLPTTPGPDGDPPGMGPGLYRVEITKEGENIPSKYNTATELGQEVSLNNPEIQDGVVKFDLKYYTKF